MGALGSLLVAIVGTPLIAMFGISIAVAGLWVANTVFRTLPTGLLTGMSAAAGLALINSIGNLGGFVGPYLTGLIRSATMDYTMAYVMFAGALAASGLVIVGVGGI